MNKRNVNILVLMLLLGTLLQAAVFADDTAHNLRVVKQHIIPAYEQLAVVAAAMNKQAESFCKNPDAQGLQQLREAFHQSMDAWQSIQHIRFGPIEFVLRMNRLQLWPDKRGSVSKHLRKLLAGKDTSALKAERFTKASVAIQGFSALEKLLFNSQITENSFSPENDDGRFHCALVQAISKNIASISANLAAEWRQGDDAYLNYISSAAQGNDFYESDREVSSTMLNNLHTQMQVIVDQKLDRPLDKSLQKARGKRAESWRSERSLRNIRLNLENLHAFYRSAFAPRLKDPKLEQAIETAFINTLKAVDAVQQPLAMAVKDSATRTQVENLRAEASQLKALIGSQLPKGLDLPLGFNSLDGD